MEPHACLAVPRRRGPARLRQRPDRRLRPGPRSPPRCGSTRSGSTSSTPFVGGGFGSKLGIHSETILAALAARVLRQPVKVAMTRQQIFQLVGVRPTSQPAGPAGRGARRTAGRRSPTTSPCTPTRDVEYAEQTAADDAQPLRRAQPAHQPPAGAARPAARRGRPRPGRGAGPAGGRVGDGRAGRCARHGPGRAADPQRAHRRSRARRAVQRPAPGRVPARRRAPVRLGAPARAPRRAPRDGPLAGRLRHGRRHPRALPGADQRRGCGLEPDGIAVVQIGHDRHRHRHLHHPDPGRGRGARPAARAGAGRARALRTSRRAAGSGGSWGATNSCTAAHRAYRRAELLALQRDARSRCTAGPGGAVSRDGSVASRRVRSAERDRRARPPDGVEARADPLHGRRAELRDYSIHTYGAHFAEVGVDADTAEIRLRRMLGVFSVGRVFNAKTARSQLIGGMIWGVGAALMEEARRRPALRRLRQPRPRELPGAGARRHPRDRRRRARRLRRQGQRCSAPRASVSWASAAPAPRSRTRCSTPPACACATSRSRSRSCCRGCRR